MVHLLFKARFCECYVCLDTKGGSSVNIGLGVFGSKITTAHAIRDGVSNSYLFFTRTRKLAGYNLCLFTIMYFHLMLKYADLQKPAADGEDWNPTKGYK